MAKKSIVSGAVGRKLLPEIRNQKSSQWVFADGRGITVRARLCGYCRNQKFEPSGGILIEATMPTPSYGGRAETYSRSLPPDWSDSQFLQAIHHTFAKHTDYLRVLKYRENAFSVCDPIAEKMEDEELDKMVKAGEDASHTAIYDEMTIDDANYWINQFSRFLKRGK